MKVGALAAVVFALAGCGPGVVWFGKSPDRTREAVVLQEGGGQRVRLDGRDEKVFLGIGIEALSWSPDGKRLAYPARVGDGWVAVVDGVVMGGAGSAVFAGIGEMVWSADGKHVAFAAEQRGRWVVVRDGVAEATVAALRARSLRFSEDGAHLGYVAEDGDKVVAKVDGASSAAYDSIGRLSFGAGGRAAFAARRGRETFVVTKGNGKASVGQSGSPTPEKAGAGAGSAAFEECAGYEDVADLAFSANGRRLAWTARKAGGWRVVVESGGGAGGVGGVEGEAFERVSKLVWAPRGERLAYSVGRGGVESVVADGVIGAAYEGVLPGSLTFDASGTHVAYAARRAGAWHVVVGAAEGPPYEEVEAPCFVGDSSAIAHLARRGAASFVVLDGHQGPVHAAASELVLSPDGKRFLHAAQFGAQMVVIEGRASGGPCGEGQCAPVESRRTLHDVLVGGTLVFSADGAHTGYVAGRASARELFLMVDGARAGAFDVEELMAGIVVEPDLAGAFTGDSKRLAQWVRAEVGIVKSRAERRSREEQSSKGETRKTP